MHTIGLSFATFDADGFALMQIVHIYVLLTTRDHILYDVGQ